MVLKQWGSAHDRPNAYFDILHVLRGHRLVEILLAETAGDLAVAAPSAMTANDARLLEIFTTERAMF
jgi:hypothetical protein